MSKEQMEKEYQILHEQLLRLEEVSKNTTTAMELVELSKAMVEVFRITKYSLNG